MTNDKYDSDKYDYDDEEFHYISTKVIEIIYKKPTAKVYISTIFP